MDYVCNRCLFSIPSKVEMAEEQEYLRCFITFQSTSIDYKFKLGSFSYTVFKERDQEVQLSLCEIRFQYEVLNNQEIFNENPRMWAIVKILQAQASAHPCEQIEESEPKFCVR